MEIIKENTKRLRWQTQHNTKGVKETEREKAIIYCLGNSTKRKNSPELRKKPEPEYWENLWIPD